MTQDKKDAILAAHDDNEPMVRVPLTAVMEQIADRAAKKAVKEQSTETKSLIRLEIEAHEFKCPTALAFAAFQNKLKGVAIGAFIFGGLSGSGLTALLFRFIASA